MTEYRKELKSGSIITVDTQFQTITTCLYMSQNDEDPTILTMTETLEMMEFLESIKQELVAERERIQNLVTRAMTVVSED